MAEQNGPLVCVSDTDRVFVNETQQLLEDEGVQVRSWMDSTSAFPSIMEEQPRPVILDLNVTNESASHAMFDALALDPATSAIPVIVASTTRCTSSITPHGSGCTAATCFPNFRPR
jgi:CheY-like chemotaxis protein